jgi:Ca-activated chloride channel family protein
MIGFRFSDYTSPQGETPFERLFNLFKELMIYTSGDVEEALSWLNELDREFQLTSDEYGMGDFIEDLKKQGYINENEPGSSQFNVSSKLERVIRQSALEEIFGKLKKAGLGNHKSNFSGKGDEQNADQRPFVFGDGLDQIAMTESLKNAMVNNRSLDFNLTERDLLINETDYKTQTSTVLMIDISHSMILYGEDRITPAKKVAMALSELIMTKYPKDTLDVIVFGNDAWQIEIKDLPYLQVGPYHTNTVAGLQLAQDLLRKRKNPNKQIFMITDGKPSCLKELGGYYKNSFGLDRKIVNKTLNEAQACRRAKINITTFMIAQDPYLQEFIGDFTQANNGKAFYTSLKGLGEFVFEDYARNKRNKYR